MALALHRHVGSGGKGVGCRIKKFGGLSAHNQDAAIWEQSRSMAAATNRHRREKASGWIVNLDRLQERTAHQVPPGQQDPAIWQQGSKCDPRAPPPCFLMSVPAFADSTWIVNQRRIQGTVFVRSTSPCPLPLNARQPGPGKLLFDRRPAKELLPHGLGLDMEAFSLRVHACAFANSRALARFGGCRIPLKANKNSI